METAAGQQQYKVGDQVKVFYRFQQDPKDLWMPVPTVYCGTCLPRVGWSDGWTTAEVVEDFDWSRFDENHCYNTGVVVRYTSPLWYSRSGEALHDELDPKRSLECIHPDCLLPADQPTPDVEVTFVVVRWASNDCDPVHEGGGGWGRTGSNVSDPYMYTLFEQNVWPALGTSYEVITVFVRSEADIKKVDPSLISMMAKGRHRVGLYFLWPTEMADSGDSPGYVPHDTVISMMVSMEAAGITSRFPHHSVLYRMLLSKDWMASLCLDANFQAPATTKVPRSLVTNNPKRAASKAIEALTTLRAAKGLESRFAEPKGVVKLGFSWEAMDVRKWSGEAELSRHMQQLIEQANGTAGAIMVQDWCDFTAELRLFFVEKEGSWDLQTNAPKLVDPTKILYSRFQSMDSDNQFRDFERMPRDDCLHICFNSDEEALASAEQQAAAIGSRVLLWLKTECMEAAPVQRLDFMVRRSGTGQATVQLGEITELGACFLGWPEGPEEVFGAVTRSAYWEPCGVAGCRCAEGYDWTAERSRVRTLASSLGLTRNYGGLNQGNSSTQFQAQQQYDAQVDQTQEKLRDMAYGRDQDDDDDEDDE